MSCTITPPPPSLVPPTGKFVLLEYGGIGLYVTIRTQIGTSLLLLANGVGPYVIRTRIGTSLLVLENGVGLYVKGKNTWCLHNSWCQS